MILSVLSLPFILMSLINLPSTIKKKDFFLSGILLMLLVASSLVIYTEVKMMLDAGYKLIN